MKELNNEIDQIIEQEAKKLIMEQIENETPDNKDNTESIKKLQTLSGLIDKISDIQNMDDVKFGVIININGVTEEDIISSYGGDSFESAQQKLMQGLHHDLEDAGMGNNFDIDINTQGEDESLDLIIKITTGENDLLGDNNMENETKSVNTDSFAKELFKAKENNKENFLYENKEFDVQKCWKQMKEEESMTEKKKSKSEILLGGDQKEIDEKDEKWIQKAVNPKHKGYCTPMTKKTCTPKRKALAKRFKKGIGEGKKIISLNEEQMKELIKRIFMEAAEPTMDATTENAINKSGKENAEYLKDVEKKIKDYLSFKGNDNPEFPNQIGQGEKKAARQNTDEQDQLMNDNRGRGPQDLDYDTDGVDDNGEPSKEFQERIEKALKGDSTMGNSQDAAGVIKTKTGEKIWDNMKRRRENLRKEPIYPKEAVPVKEKKESEPLRPVNEEEEKKKSLVKEDIRKMKRLSSYNEKTQ